MAGRKAWWVLRRGKGWSIEVRVSPGLIERAVKVKGQETVIEQFPGCSIRQRGGVKYIGGPCAPDREWTPTVPEVKPEADDG